MEVYSSMLNYINDLSTKSTENDKIKSTIVEPAFLLTCIHVLDYALVAIQLNIFSEHSDWRWPKKKATEFVVYYSY